MRGIVARDFPFEPLEIANRWGRTIAIIMNLNMPDGFYGG